MLLAQQAPPGIGRAGGLPQGICSERLLLPALHTCQVHLTHTDFGHHFRCVQQQVGFTSLGPGEGHLLTQKVLSLADLVPRPLLIKHPSYQPRSSTISDLGLK